jgi:hypothetical protein
MDIIGAIGGKNGGIPVTTAENKGVINPTEKATGIDIKNPTVAIGMNIGKKIEPSPIKWKSMGKTIPRALKTAPIVMSFPLEVIISNINIFANSCY